MTINNKAEAINAYIEGGFILHPLIGKIPTQRQWQKLKFELHTEADFPNNYGVVLQPHQVVIDLDPRNYKDGDLPWRRLLKDCGLDPEIHRRTFWIKTGGKGTHIYFSIPSDIEIIKHIPGFLGLEFLTKGSYVVGPYSVHPDTKAPYEIGGGSPKMIAPLPDVILDKIKRGVITEDDKKLKKAEKTQIEDESAQALKRYIDFLKTCPAAIQGEQGDKQTFMAAIRGHDIGLSKEKTLDLMLEFFNPRCNPPWVLAELKRKVKNAYIYANQPKGNDSPILAFENDVPVTAGYIVKRARNGEIKKTLANVEQFFLNQKSPLVDSLIYDDFLEQVIIIKKMPWDKEACPSLGRQWTETDSILCKGFLSTLVDYGTDFPVALIYEATIHAAHRQRRHPVKEYLQNLKWDRRERLDRWLVSYLGANNTPYTLAIGAKVLMAATARIMQPGVKFDHLLILEGKQGIGKSRTVATLGGQWYGDIIITPHEKDTISAMRSKWIIEVSEMEYNSRVDAAAIKSFMTRQSDIMRLPYERAVRSIARQSILIATINPEGDGAYLKDSTGNRRFWPVLAHKIDLASLTLDRDQLFAEALERWSAGEPLWLDKKEIEEDARREQIDRTSVDPWTERIVDWLNCNEQGKIVVSTTGLEIFERAMRGEARWYKRKEANQIADIMKKLGFVQKQYWDADNRKPKRGYVRPEYAADEVVPADMEIVQ